MGYISIYEDFPKEIKIKDLRILITAYSYEDRSIESTIRIIKLFNIKKAIIFNYDVYNYLDSDILIKWEKNKKKIISLLKNQKIERIDFKCQHDNISVIYNLKEEIELDQKIIIDITCFTKNNILKLAQVFDSNNTNFFYTRSKETRLLTIQESSASIDRIEPIEGFEGNIEINKKDLMILLLGFEGNRALAFLNKYETEPIYTLISSPFLENNEENLKYINNAKKANIQLLNIHRVFNYENIVHSLDPFIVAEEIDAAIKKFNNFTKYNLCFSCLGTKLQTLGLYIYWKNHQDSQILYTIPIKRYDFSKGIGVSYVINLNVDISRS